MYIEKKMGKNFEQKWLLIRVMYNIDIAEIILENMCDKCQICQRMTPILIDKAGRFCSMECYNFI